MIWDVVDEPGRRHRHLALGVDGQAGGVLRHRDGGLHRIARGGDDPPGIVHLEGAVAGILKGAVRHQDLEKSLAGDGEIEIVAGHRQRSLGHRSRRSDGLDAAADIDTHRQDGALIRGLGADPADMLVDQILEFGGLLLVTGGLQVRDVVGDDLDAEFLGRHSGRSSMKSLHVSSP